MPATSSFVIISDSFFRQRLPAGASAKRCSSSDAYRSAHTEAGWMAGKGKKKKTVVYIPEMQEAELMYKLFDLVSDDLDEISSF